VLIFKDLMIIISILLLLLLKSYSLVYPGIWEKTAN